MMLTIVLVRLGDKVAGCYRPALWIAGQVQYDGPGWIRIDRLLDSCEL